jgi:Arc/MetJ-type ribon-helix-helix transcriptional regulator
MSPALLEQVEALAKRNYMSRSSLIRAALIEYLRKPENAARLAAQPGEDVELKLFLEEYKKDHPESGLL